MAAIVAAKAPTPLKITPKPTPEKDEEDRRDLVTSTSPVITAASKSRSSSDPAAAGRLISPNDSLFVIQRPRNRG